MPEIIHQPEPLELPDHDYPFDPTYGYDTNALLAVNPPEEPDDFAAFWSSTFQKNADIPVHLEQSHHGKHQRFEIYQVTFDSWDHFRTQAWVLIPRDAEIHTGVVVGHGYAGREHPDFRIPIHNAAFIFPVARGFDLSADPRFPRNDAAAHVIHGIESRDSYILRGCVAELWSAASALQELVPQIGENLMYYGVSFGGGLGALMLPWDQRFKQAFLEVPTFGQHPLRLQCPCAGSGEAVREYVKQHPEATKVLRYYDAAIAARHIQIPMLTAPALFDPAVPPPGQFAVSNAISGEHQRFILTAGHYTYPALNRETRKLRKAVRTFFSV